MKKLFTMVITATALTLGVSQKATAQVEQGNICIDAYIGAPTGNMWFRTESSYLNFETVGLPISYGGRVEYMAADNFGIGIDVNYVISGYEYTEQDYYYDDVTGQYSDATGRYDAKKLRAMLRLNYHFVQTDALDVYVGFGAGYKSAKRSFYYDNVEDASASFDALLPVAVRIAIGGRFYFTDNIGANFELGAGGGGLIQGGLALKF